MANMANTGVLDSGTIPAHLKMASKVSVRSSLLLPLLSVERSLSASQQPSLRILQRPSLEL